MTLPLKHKVHLDPSCPPRSRRRVLRRGMTIPEVLIAATLLAFVIMSSLKALTEAFRLTRHARMVTLAGQIVQSTMEDLRLRNYSSLKAYAAQSQPVNFTSSLASERFSSAFTQGFTLSGTFTTLIASNTGTPGKISASLTVTWSEAGSVFSRKITTYFGEQGLSDYFYVGWAP
jgi:Tfp pilus assembly protein PilV